MGWITTPIAMLFAAGAGTAATVYSTKTAAGVNQSSIEAQRAADAAALQAQVEAQARADEQRRIEAERAEQLRRYEIEQQMLLEQQRRRAEAAALAARLKAEQDRWDAMLKIQQPYLNVGQQAFYKLSDLLGLKAPKGGGGFTMPTTPPPNFGTASVAAAPPRVTSGPSRSEAWNLLPPAPAVSFAPSEGRYPRMAAPTAPVLSVRDLLSMAEMGRRPQQTGVGDAVLTDEFWA